MAIDSPKGQIRLERTGGAAPPTAEGGGEGRRRPGRRPNGGSTEPLAARADSFAVDRLLDGLAALEKTRTLDDVDPKAVGLDKPRAIVRLTTKTGEKVLQARRRGAARRQPDRRRATGQKGAYVVGDAILSEVDKAPGDWRDRLIFRGDREAIRRITLTGARGRAGRPRPPAGRLPDRAPVRRPRRSRPGGRPALGPHRPHRRPLPGRLAAPRGAGARAAARDGRRGLRRGGAAGADRARRGR